MAALDLVEWSFLRSSYFPSNLRHRQLLFPRPARPSLSAVPLCVGSDLALFLWFVIALPAAGMVPC
jgi:hypothetical protein